MKKDLNFIGKSKVFFGISLAIIAIGLICNIIFGATLDIQFKGGTIVNYSYTGEIDQEALTEALKEGRLAGAALDVFTPEPLPKDDPLYDLPNVILTPHVAGNMSLSYTSDLNVDIFCRNLERYFNGEELHHVVDRKLGY